MAVMRTKWHNTYEHLAQSPVHFKLSVNLSYYFDDDYHHLSFRPPQKERQQVPLGEVSTRTDAIKGHLYTHATQTMLMETFM